MFRAMLQTVVALVALGLAIFFMTIGVTVGPVRLGGMGGLPALTAARLHPRTLADLGTDARLVVYAALFFLGVLLVLDALLSYWMARSVGYRLGQRLIALQRVPSVRAAFAWSGALLTLVRGGTAVAAGAPSLPGPHTPSPLRSALVRAAPGSGPASPDGAALAGRQAPDARGERHRASATGRVIRPGRVPVRRRRVVEALRYIVQPNDILRAVALRYYNDEMRWPEIYRASTGIAQPGGVRLDNPDRIYPGEELHIPLPAANLAIDGDRVAYIVQPGDTLQSIAARFLGDWRLYSAIAAATGGRVQADPGRIYPGMHVYLPAADTVTRTMVYERTGAHIAARPTAARAVRAARRARRQASAATSHTASGRAATLHRAPPSVATAAPSSAPPAAVVRPRHASNARDRSHHPAGAGTRQAHRVAHRYIAVKRKQGARVGRASATCPVRPVATPSIYRPTPGRALRRSPTVRQPNSPFVLPTALVALLIAGAAGFALRRRRGPFALPAAGRVPAALRRRIHRARAGVPPQTVVAVRRQVRGDEGPRVPYVLAALDRVARAGAPQPVDARPLPGPDAVRAAVERAAGVDLIFDPRDIDAAGRAALVARLGQELGGAPVSSTLAAGAVTLSVAQGPITSDQVARPFAAPLVVPIGQTIPTPDRDARDATYVNLAAGSAVIAAGETGATGLVRTIIGALLMQAEPDQLRLMVATADPSLRDALPALGPYLAHAVVDASDADGVVGLVEHADAISEERFDALGAPAQATWPWIVVLIDGADALAARGGEICEKLQTLVKDATAMRISVLLTSDTPLALASVSLTPIIPIRLSYRLSAPESRALFGDEARARDLTGREIYLQGAGVDGVLIAYELAPTAIADMIAQRAARLATAAYVMDVPEAPDVPETLEAPGAVAAAEVSAPRPAAATGDGGVDGDTDEGTDATAMGAAPPESAPIATHDGAREAGVERERLTVVGRGGGAPEAPVPDEISAAAAALAEVRVEAATDAPLKVKILNDFSVYDRGHRVEGIDPVQMQILGVICAVGPLAVPGDTISERLRVWERDVRNRKVQKQRTEREINKLVSKLRTQLRAHGLEGDPIKYDSQLGYALNPEVATCDRYFLTALRAHIATAGDADVKFALRQQYREAYLGDLWPYEEEAWVEGIREAERRHYLATLAHLAEGYDKRGDLTEAITVAEDLCLKAPTDERGIELLLEYYFAVGDKGRLEDRYRRYGAAMEEDGMEPTRKVKDQYLRYRKATHTA